MGIPWTYGNWVIHLYLEAVLYEQPHLDGTEKEGIAWDGCRLQSENAVWK